MNLFGAIAQGGRSVGSLTGKISLKCFPAVKRVTIETTFTNAARVVAQNYVVSWLERVNRASDGLNNPGAFMTENDGLRHRVGLIAHGDIGVTHSGRHHTH
jgi:hypothetical protein